MFHFFLGLSLPWFVLPIFLSGKLGFGEGEGLGIGGFDGFGGVLELFEELAL